MTLATGLTYLLLEAEIGSGPDLDLRLRLLRLCVRVRISFRELDLGPLPPLIEHCSNIQRSLRTKITTSQPLRCISRTSDSLSSRRRPCLVDCAAICPTSSSTFPSASAPTDPSVTRAFPSSSLSDPSTP
ncbi:hypothetical protein CGCS363_v012849 [Colletotrichum siamense]|uniref:uncharacterized protein n=1 Tax=Colletotrichum siamense TaxID=690259 RepID=UPI001872862D|nr:uncharacterized protein CGCS363_v012849 [Colletotrichum siamense]KAF5487115.1 hypothetical protein CGCS363_v012849 [Colletotrichum siamense]